MTKEQFMKAAGINAILADKWYSHIVATMQEFGIDTPKRKSAFIAQTGLAIFGSRLTAAQREQLGRKPGEPALSAARQAAIANLVYGGRYGNNLNGDGWKYRGRGLKQVTFKSNYEACGKALGLDLVNNPDLLIETRNAARSAGWFWKSNNLNRFADNGDFNGLTKAINGGLNGIDDRRARLKVAEGALC